MAKQTFTTGQVLTAAQMNSLQSNDFNQTVSVKTAAYTLVVGDRGTRVEFNTSGSVTCTVNTGIFDAGDTVIIQNRGAGAVTVTAGTATVNTSATLVLAQYDSGTLYFISTSAAIFFNSDSGASPLTTKGDLYTYSTADDRLAVGNSGETLVADSSATTGLRWQGNYAAGKNAIINGDFRINQRAFTSNTSSGSFNYDRFWQSNSGGTVTTTPNVFTPGSAPVAGYEGTNFPQIAVTGQSAASHYAHYSQSIEDVRTLAGQTITISFWAKASSGTPKIGVEWQQFFGSGGSSAVSTPAGAVTISTSWTRYSITISSPSLSGKTIGTSSGVNLNFWLSAGSDSATRASSIGIQTATFQLWGVQVEAGSVATAFQTATGTLAGELAACQRYYEKSYADTTAPGSVSDGYVFNGLGTHSGQKCMYGTKWIVKKRTNPTWTVYDRVGNSGKITTLDSGGTGTDNQTIALVSSDANGWNYLGGNNGTYSGFKFNWVADAEL